MSSITFSSSTSILVVLTRWNISSWSWTGRWSCSGFVASSFKPAFRKQFLMVETTTWSQLWETHSMVSPTFTFFYNIS
jgi:hypothetical protein